MTGEKIKTARQAPSHGPGFFNSKSFFSKPSHTIVAGKNKTMLYFDSMPMPATAPTTSHLFVEGFSESQRSAQMPKLQKRMKGTSGVTKKLPIPVSGPSNSAKIQKTWARFENFNFF